MNKLNKIFISFIHSIEMFLESTNISDSKFKQKNYALSINFETYHRYI